MDSEDGQLLVKNLACFVRTHERALANALHLQRLKPKNAKQSAASAGASALATTSSAPISLAEALPRSYLFWASQNIKPAKLTLTPHHLFYLLSKFEDLGVDVGPMNVRLENLHSNAAPSNYVSFLGHAPKSRGKQSEVESLRSVSSVWSVMSSMSSMWSALTNSTAKAEKQMAQYRDDLRYLYSCFTKLPALRLAPNPRAKLIRGFEEFPFDTAVPLFAFKNVSSLEILDLDFRQFHGWDRMSEQLRSLVVKRGGVDDPIDLLQNIVLDDAEKRRKRSSKTQATSATPSNPGLSWLSSSPKPASKHLDIARSASAPTTPLHEITRHGSLSSSIALPIEQGRRDSVEIQRLSSNSPPRPQTARHSSLQKSQVGRLGGRRSSGSSVSSQHEMTPQHSYSDLLGTGRLPSSKWRFLRHLSLAENGLTHLNVGCLAPVANTLQSCDLSGNLFYEIPDELTSLTHLRALNLSNCMIDSLSSLTKHPLPAVTTLNLRANRLLSLAGIERLCSLERLDLRENRLHDPTEMARLTGMPAISDLYVVKNPFTRTHNSYRITIFNLFRSSPGHVDDVVIDTMGPLYHEKKHLVDRVPGLANRPIMKLLPVDDELPSHDPGDILTSIGTEGLHKSIGNKGHRRTISDMGPRPTVRRKKGPRRRVVELSQAEQMVARQMEEQSLAPTLPELTELPPMPHTPKTARDQDLTVEALPYQIAPLIQSQQRPSSTPPPKFETGFNSSPRIRDASDDDASPVQILDEIGSNTGVYRQKIEALKSELGPTWLSALSEERFAEPTAMNRSYSPTPRPSGVRSDVSRGISVGGRTLG